MGKPSVYMCESKDADQMCSNYTADYRLCFRYTDSTCTLLLKSKIQASSAKIQIVFDGLCQSPR